MWTRHLLLIITTIALLGIHHPPESQAYSRGICSSRGPRVSFHVHSGYHHRTKNDELFFLLMLSSTSTTTYCLTLADEEEDWRQRRHRDRRRYSSINYEYIQAESAQGQGEYLAALADLHGCDDRSVTVFSAALQTNYETLFPDTQETDPDGFLNNLQNIIRNTPILRASCTP